MSEFKMISFPCLLLLLAGCVAGHRKHEDFSMKCERIADQKGFNLLCNLTDNRDIDSSCQAPSLLIPRFSPITIKCAVDMPFPYNEVQCKILYDGKTSDEEILRLNGKLLLNALEHDERVLDGFVKFERILSNALAIGEALIRCKNSMFKGENDLFSCSLFGIGDKASVIANMSCSSASSSSAQTYTMTMIQCGFSEDHQSAKVRGNMTLALKFFNDGMRMAADVLFSARSNSPMQNVMETVRLDCHVSPVDGILVCGAYSNEGRFCDNPECCEDQQEEGTSSIRDRVWELDRTLVFDVDQQYFGKAQLTCNLADDVQAKILKCSLHYANGSILIDSKSIVDMTAIDGSVVINSVEMVLINVSNRITYKNILGRLQCHVQNPQSMSTTYSVTCTFPLLPNYVIEGNLTDSNKDPTKIAITFDGQLRAANKPGGLNLNSFCSADILAPMTRVNAKCMVNFGTNEELCEMFAGNETLCNDGLLATLLNRL